MKNIKYIFAVIMLAVIFTPYLAAEDGILYGRGLLNALREKRQAQQASADVSHNAD